MQRLIIGVSIIVLLWAVGFASFVGRLPAPAVDAPDQSDGVVVYTGGPDRITAGMEIFAKGHGDRLLISGVHHDTSRERLATMWTGAPAQFDCCVDLGREALTTEGNAAEVGAWARDNDYHSLILVTSEYHMPRALVSTRARLSDATIAPYAVSSGYIDSQGRPATIRAWVKLSGEYAKYLLAQLKALFSQFGN